MTRRIAIIQGHPDGVRAFEHSMLSFAGIKPIRESLYGLSHADDQKRAL
jgi:hypothetical protein